MMSSPTQLDFPSTCSFPAMQPIHSHVSRALTSSPSNPQENSAFENSQNSFESIYSEQSVMSQDFLMDSGYISPSQSSTNSSSSSLSPTLFQDHFTTAPYQCSMQYRPEDIMNSSPQQMNAEQIHEQNGGYSSFSNDLAQTDINFMPITPPSPQASSLNIPQSPQQNSTPKTNKKQTSKTNQTAKPKRKRRITKDQRNAANQRERRRMVTLNQAFEDLQERIPTFSYEKKLSRIETLKLAIGYIWFMREVLNGAHPEDINLSYFIDSLPLLGSKIDRLYTDFYGE